MILDAELDIKVVSTATASSRATRTRSSGSSLRRFFTPASAISPPTPCRSCSWASRFGPAVGAMWGTALLGGLLPEAGISWQGHLFGAVGGIVAARVLAPLRAEPTGSVR